MDGAERPPGTLLMLETSSSQFLPAAGESINGPGRGRICVLLRKSAQSASWFRPTIPAEEPASLSGHLGEEHLDAEGCRGRSQRGAEGGYAAPASPAPSD